MKRVSLWFSVIGPGMMVMLADTDAGCIVTAAQSGALFGYAMILPQLLLIPVLYFIQEITVRLGVITQKGHAELIREHFGSGWGYISVITLFISCIGALVTDFAGIAGVGELLQIPSWLSVPIITGLLIALGLSGSYRRVERIGIAIGLLELLFILAVFIIHPDPVQVAHGIAHIPIQNHHFLFLLAANIGAVIMPWMIFYQQGAIVDKSLRGIAKIKIARWDTCIGAVITQCIMISVILVLGFAASSKGISLEKVQDIILVLQPFLGNNGAIILFGLGIVGAGFIGALVVSLAATWSLGEVLGVNHSLNMPFNKAKVFYLIYILAHVGGAAIVLSGLPLIALTIDIEVMNALLLPIVLGFLLALEHVALPPKYRMRGLYKTFACTVSAGVILFGLFIAGSVVLQIF